MATESLQAVAEAWTAGNGAGTGRPPSSGRALRPLNQRRHLEPAHLRRRSRRVDDRRRPWPGLSALERRAGDRRTSGAVGAAAAGTPA